MEFYNLWEQENYSPNQFQVDGFLPALQKNPGLSCLSLEDSCRFLNKKTGPFDEIMSLLSVKTWFVLTAATTFQIKLWSFQNLTSCTYLIQNFWMNIHSLQVLISFLLLILKKN